MNKYLSHEYLVLHSFLFGRQQVGALFELLGEMTFADDGRVTSYRNRNEAFWRLDGDRLIFLDCKQRQTSVMSISSDFGDRQVLTGISDIDGNKLFLYRKHQRRLGDTRVVYAVATNEKYGGRALMSLLKQFGEMGIVAQDVSITVIGVHESHLESVDGIRVGHIMCKPRSIGPLVDLARAPKLADYYVLLDESCVLGRSFCQLISMIELIRDDLELILFSPRGEDHLGVYSDKFLKRISGFLFDLNSSSIEHSSPHQSDSWIRDRAQSYTSLLPCSITSLFKAGIREKRVDRFFPSVDLHIRYPLQQNEIPAILLNADIDSKCMIREVQYPDVHPNVSAQMEPYSGPAPISFYPVSMDLKYAEAFRTQFIAKGRTRFAFTYDRSAIPVFAILPFKRQRLQRESLFCGMCPFLSIFFDLHDPQGDKIEFSDNMWNALAKSDAHVLYIKLQVHDADFYRRNNRLPERFHVITAPLLLGGSRFHITWGQDFEGDTFFARTFSDVVPELYEFDWCWVGALTSGDRRIACGLLDRYTGRRRAFNVAATGHTDAKLATVPYSEYLKMSSRSHINVSLNGNGPWCLKDGELLSHRCFILRQSHSTLSLCPLSPRSGEHWVMASTEDLVKTIEYYLANQSECVRIRDTGNQLMRQVLFNELWANEYARHLEAFNVSFLKAAWGKLAIA